MRGGNGDDFGFRRPREPIFLLPPLVTALVAVPVALVVIRAFLSPGADETLVYTFGFVPDRIATLDAADAWPGGPGAVVWTFLTHALLHEGWSHVLINMAMFAALARPVLARIGTGRFLAFLAVATIAGALGHLAVAWGSDVPMIGASGTVSGLLGALLRFVFAGPWGRTQGIVESLREPRVRGAIAALVLMNVVLVFFGSGLVGGEGGGIAWGAHLGGFLAGFLGFSAFEPARPHR
jgi:membrane associated rhomboid family serine protease